MECKPNILSPYAVAIKRLVETDDLHQALDILDEWVGVLGGNYWKEITMLKRQHHKLRSAQMSGCLSFSENLMEEQKLALSILCLVEDLNNCSLLEVTPIAGGHHKLRRVANGFRTSAPQCLLIVQHKINYTSSRTIIRLAA
jgi:hypothetical protein